MVFSRIRQTNVSHKKKIKFQPIWMILHFVQTLSLVQFRPTKNIYSFREEFEDLPILRSTFFHYGIRLSRNEGLLSSVVYTDKSGKAEIYMKSRKNIMYHYSLTAFMKGSSSLSFKRKRIPLDR